ncbi:MAG: glycerol-3-phosphate 1-O-acyltransferase PlsY [Elusimicrobiota bacterium]
MNFSWTPLIVAIVISYLTGSIPTAYLIARVLKGIDIREIGSGNVGATNVWRNVGRGAGVLTLVIDAVKGFLPVFILKYFISGGEVLIYASALAVVSGHIWTPWLEFKGGKGVATGTGVLAALSIYSMLFGLGIFIIVLTATKYISASSISGAIAASFFCWIDVGTPVSFKVIMTILCVLIIIRHKDNIRRLIAGNETKLKI